MNKMALEPGHAGGGSGVPGGETRWAQLLSAEARWLLWYLLEILAGQACRLGPETQERQSR